MSIKSLLLSRFRKPYHRNRYTDEAIKDTVNEIFWYLIFLITVNIVAFSSRTVMMYYFSNTVERVFLKRTFLTTSDIEISYEEIVTVDDWWKFMEESFINGIHLPKTNVSHDRKVIFENSVQRTKHSTRKTKTKASYDDPHFAFLEESIFLGPPRIRQRKVRDKSCEIHSAFERYFRSCFSRYSIDNDAGDSENDDPGYFIWGKLGLYKGGGKTNNLKVSKEENKNILQGMKTSGWIERRTRLIVVEFNLYNANTNLFCIVKFIAELPPIGGVIPSYSIRTFDMLYVGTPYQIFIIIVKALFFIQIIIYSIREVVEVYQIRWKYFKRFWNWISLAVLVMGLLVLIYDVVRFVSMKIFLKKFNLEPAKYLDMDFIAFWHYHVTNIIALCTFFVWIQIFKYISFNTTMLQFSLTLRRCAVDLFGFGVMFAIVFVAFAELGYLLFGTMNRDFRTMADSILTMMRTILGDFEYLAIEEANRVLGPIFFLTYIFFVFFVLLNMFLAIINDTYSEVKSESTEDNIQIMSYFKRKLGKFCECLCCGRKIFRYKDTLQDEKLTSESRSKSRTTSDNLRTEKDITDSKQVTEDIELTGPQSQTAEPPIFLQDNIVIPRKDVLKKLFREVGPDEYEAGRESANIEPIQAQVENVEERLQNLEMVMDNFVRRMNDLINKLDSDGLLDSGRSY